MQLLFRVSFPSFLKLNYFSICSFRREGEKEEESETPKAVIAQHAAELCFSEDICGGEGGK